MRLSTPAGAARLDPLPLHRFPRAARVRKRGDFLRVQGSRFRVTTRHFVLLFAPSPAPRGRPSPGEPKPDGTRGSSSTPRLGIVATRKVGVAVVRNRVKRLCRECFRTWRGVLPEGLDLVVIARPGANTLGLAGVREEWNGVERLVRRRAAEALAQRGDLTHGSVGASATRRR